ncbi:hypothetical protein CBF34_03510 [Vagococcus penaei]|uniref:Uncharacterized protein n=1 Tax=Vagococcus penaei TaxID=633807 RepID=A0A1Q2D7I6_9ENTE|nr:CRISPR-associated protein Csn2-St [Vagococcus penaei]AQP54280.1 hypothetical protein BW732_08620 [Vagococcus penaei]RSU05835.1 hypothetical protein CBF34_03510 [Vagococcus penaei]
MTITFEYENSHYLELTEHPINYLYGSNHDVKWKLYRGLKRFYQGKNLSLLEETVYGDDGIDIRLDGQTLKSKDILFHFLDCRESFITEFKLLKTSLIYNYLQNCALDFDVTRLLDQVNNQLLALEIKLQRLTRDILTNVSPTIKPLTYPELMKSYMGLETMEDGVNYPVEMIDLSALIDDYCHLLEQNIERTTKQTWLFISQPTAFLRQDLLAKLLLNLTKVNQKTELLTVFILSDSYCPLNYRRNDIEATTLIYKEYQQLPDFTTLRASIERHYPDTLTLTDDELITSLYRLMPYIGVMNSEQVYLKDQELLLLNVLHKLLGIDIIVKSPKKVLTKLEEAYLM